MSEEGSAEVLDLKTRMMMRIMHIVFFLTRSMTMGVRAACFDEQGRVFLVRHSYVPGWYLPGGGIERHETAAMTLIKELREEGNLVATSKPELFHIYLNRAVSKRDHVLLYRLDVRQTEIRKPDYEIRESGFFDPDNLPAEATVATRRRLCELRGEVPPADLW